MLKNAPLNEAAFLGHNSNAFLSSSHNYWDSKTRSDNLGNKVSQESKAHHIGAGIEYFVEQFYLNGQVGLGEDVQGFNFNATLRF